MELKLYQHENAYHKYFRYCERTYGQGIWYDEDKSAIDKPLEEMVDWYGIV